MTSMITLDSFVFKKKSCQSVSIFLCVKPLFSKIFLETKSIFAFTVPIHIKSDFTTLRMRYRTTPGFIIQLSINNVPTTETFQEESYRFLDIETGLILIKPSECYNSLYLDAALYYQVNTLTAQCVPTLRVIPVGPNNEARH